MDLAWVKDFLDLISKAWSIKEKKKMNSTWSKSKIFVLWKTLLRRWEDKPQSGRRYLQTQIIYPIKG